jgi:hypothetical protein
MNTYELDLNTCPCCCGVADNGHSRDIPPVPYVCTTCEEGQNEQARYDMESGHLFMPNM